MKKQNLRILLSGFCLSSLIALVAFLFLMAEKFGSHLLWESWGHSVPFPNLYKGLLLLVGGFLVFALKRKWGSLPRTSHELMEELKEGQTGLGPTHPCNGSRSWARGPFVGGSHCLLHLAGG